MRSYFKGTARNEAGDILASATISVYLAGTITPASIYTTLSGAVAVNSVTSAADGTFSFYVSFFDYNRNQKFKIIASKTGEIPTTWDNLHMDSIVIGTYAIADDTIVTTNLGYIPNGVLLAPATGKTLTIDGPFEAGLYQVFDCDGTGKVVFGANSPVTKVYPEWFGASPTVANNTPYLEQAVASIGTGLYKTIVLSQGYPVTEEWVVDSLRHFTIDFAGGYINASNCNAMTLSNALEGEVKGLNLTSSTQAANWASGYNGLTMNNVYEVKLDVQRVAEFNKGLNFEPTGAGSLVSEMNNITLNRMRNNKYDIYIKPGTQGYVTELSFYGGSFGLDSGVYAGASGDYSVYVETGSLYGVNNIRFYSPRFENKHGGIYAADGVSFALYSPRFEAVPTWLSGKFTYSTFIFGANSGIDNEKLDLTATSQYNLWLGYDYNGVAHTALTFESDYGSWGFRDPYGRSVTNRTEFLSTINAVRNINADGTAQIYNKQYQGATVPASGTYRYGSIVWNDVSGSLVAGHSLGWFCSVGGTAGTLTGVTFSGKSGDAFGTVNTVVGLHISDIVTIAGVSGTKTIIGVKGTTVYLNSAINATVTNAAVAFSNPTWLQIAAQVSYRSGASSPAGSVTPFFIGEEYLHTTGNHWFKAHGLTSSDWTALN